MRLQLHVFFTFQTIKIETGFFFPRKNDPIDPLDHICTVTLLFCR
jgi:hypothetical protein